ncbi:MAG: TolC family protein [Bradymonadaceae bacterium]
MSLRHHTCQPIRAAVLLGLLATAFPARAGEETNGLTVDRAVESSLGRESFERSQSARLEALAGERADASSFPNPTLAVDREQHWEGGEAVAEDFFVLEQTLPIWGTRRLRAKSVEAKRRASRSTNAAQRLERRLETRRAFYDALRQRRRLEAAKAFTEQLETSVELLEARQKAGDASSYAVARLRRSLDEARATVEEARASLVRARGQLGGLIGRSPTPLEAWSVEGDLLAVELPALAELSGRVDDRPTIEALRERARAQAELRRALGRRLIPTPTLRGGYKRIDAPTDGSFHGIVVGLSTQLPLFNQESGQRREAAAKRNRLRALARLRRQRAGAKLQSAHRAAEMRLDAARTYRNDAVPRAEQLLERARERREAGTGTLFELLDAHRTVYETRIHAIERAWRARSAVVDVRKYAGGFP